jgi:hypothetical protein
MAGPAETPPPAKPPRTVRLIHTVTQVATCVLIWWVATVGQLYAATFRELAMTQLPALTEVVIKLSDVLLQPGVLVVGGAAVLALIVVGHFGLIDRALAPLIVADLFVIACALVGWLVGLQQPMRKIHEQLSP